MLLGNTIKKSAEPARNGPNGIAVFGVTRRLANKNMPSAPPAKKDKKSNVTTP